jgi:hypothetical protein
MSRFIAASLRVSTILPMAGAAGWYHSGILGVDEVGSGEGRFRRLRVEGGPPGPPP